MSRQNVKGALEKMLKNCPDCITPAQAAGWSPFGKNKIYTLINSGEIPSYNIGGTHCIAKSDLIAYICEHANDTGGISRNLIRPKAKVNKDD